MIWSNPKALVFLGAIIPQFVDPATDPTAQTVMLGVTFMAVATVFDGAYAVVAGNAGRLLTHANVRRVELASGASLIAGGLWLAFARR